MATFGEQSLFPLMQQVPEFVSRTAYHAARVMKFAVTHMQACNGEKLSSKMHLRKVQMHERGFRNSLEATVVRILSLEL